ncbi:class I SAM-dependent methyltransferase [Dermacoccaceae bacterium W4C1]
MSGVADRLAALLIPVVGEPLPVRISAWDGSCVGPQGVPVVTVHSAEALSRILWSPGELGAAQAYVTGGISVDIPIDEALRHIWAVARERDLPPPRPRPAQVRELASLVKELGLWRKPDRPASQVHVRGRLHSRGRDAAVIAAHYDISNAFYARILDETMAYSSGYVRRADLDSVENEQYSLGDAQRDKLELICRKLGLADHGAPRLLDVGCGWGSLSLYAAENYGARVTGVTIAAEQKEYIDTAAAERGLADLVSIRLQDYRDVDDGGYDAVASIEMGEHAGDRGYPDFVRTLRRNVTDTGRVLVQQMSRQGRHPGGGPFIESFIAADMTMRPVGQTVDLMEQGGLEVRDVHTLREHYAWTARAWQGRFRARRQELTDLLGEEVVRVWELYLAGGMLAFEQGRMGVDQILAVPAGTGPSNLPAVRTW